MATVLILGVSGAGKSSLASELGRRGLEAIDSDEVLGRWVDGADLPVECPPEPDRAWLINNHWRWNPEQAEELLTRSSENTMFVCGSAENIMEFIGRFDLVILLEVDIPTMLRRLDQPTRGNDFGRIGDTRKVLIEWAPGFQAQMKELGASVVDAGLPLESVADVVVRLAQDHGLMALPR
ncbi:hypothetical protein [Streptomyces lunaelactis]|uniref:hypothetical protein n=2 Tax=Streptomyces TaxID=1883 RepID=UPI0015856A3D|nr:hypothetical protein [Streptomyces lunaelactis]NUK18277.1 hypothetical protein [Streptomyces lunaelactis]